MFHFAITNPAEYRPGTPHIICLTVTVICALSAFTAPTAAAEVNSLAEGRALIAMDPTDPEYYLEAGRALRRNGDSEQAIVILEEGRQRAEPSPELLLTLGFWYSEESRWSEAEIATMKAVGMQPSDMLAHLQLADIFHRTSQHERALESFRHVLARSPENQAAQCGLIYALLASDQYADAEEAAMEFISKDRQRPDLWVALGEVMEAQERLQGAFSCYGEALRANPALAAAHSRRGRLYCRFRQFDAAVVECRTALELDPEDSLAHAYLGIACAHLGDEETARTHALKAEAAGLHMGAVWQELKD